MSNTIVEWFTISSEMDENDNSPSFYDFLLDESNKKRLKVADIKKSLKILIEGGFDLKEKFHRKTIVEFQKMVYKYNLLHFDFLGYCLIENGEIEDLQNKLLKIDEAGFELLEKSKDIDDYTYLTVANDIKHIHENCLQIIKVFWYFHNETIN